MTTVECIKYLREQRDMREEKSGYKKRAYKIVMMKRNAVIRFETIGYRMELEVAV